MKISDSAFWRTRLIDLWVAFFRILPHRGLSCVMHWFAQIETPTVKNFLNRNFVSWVDINMEEAQIEDPEAYPTLGALFVRSLKPERRPWPENSETLATPCDCRVSQFGKLEDGNLIQAKGRTYTAAELLGPELSELHQGYFATLYLSPQDCHRVYMPTAGTLLEMRHFPGRQLSVSQHAAQRIPKLYARNERVACIFKGNEGSFAVVLVGAANVASIEVAWQGLVTPRSRVPTHWNYRDEARPPPITLQRGDELGCFHLGSTVILLTNQENLGWPSEVTQDCRLLYGQPLLVPQVATEEESV